MARGLAEQVCYNCAKAKRKCGKQAPHCVRCRNRGIECVYPAAKPTHFVLYRADYTAPVDQVISANPMPQVSADSPNPQSADVTLGIDSPELSNHDFGSNAVPSSWFASPETWKIYRYPAGESKTFCMTDLKRIIKKTHRWLIQWVETGSNYFIHPRLYQSRFPRRVQDAYMALSSYNHKTTLNEAIVAGIVHDRAKELVSHYDSPGRESTFDSLEHIARVHALLVYQVIGFHDGDIRLRYLAETHIPVLNSWMQQMVQHASQTVCLGASMVPPDPERLATGFTVSDITNSENILWYSWILAEAIRRTYLVASGIQGIYETVQQGRRASCQGGMMFTTREGVWEAQSAFEWEKLCSAVNVGLMRIEDSE